MEQRNVELLAVGVSLGTSFLIDVSDPESAPGIGSPFTVELLLLPSVTIEAPELKELKLLGHELKDGPHFQGIDEDGRFRYRLELVPLGKPGPSMTRFIIKGEMFKATLAITEKQFEITAPMVKVIQPGSIMEWGPGDQMAVTIDLLAPDPGTHTVGLTISLIDEEGMVVCREERNGVKVRGGTSLMVVLSEPLKISTGDLDLDVKVVEKQQKSRFHFEKAIKLLGGDTFHAVLEGIPAPGEDGIVSISGDVPVECMEQISVVIEGQGDVQEVPGTPDGSRVSFHYPDHLSGQVDLHLVICGKRHDLGEFKVRDGDKIDLQSVRFVPDTVSPGSFSTLVIRYDVGDGAGDDLGGVLEIEGMDPPRLDFSISSSENVKEIEVRIPDRTIVGKMSPILTLRSGVETISRSVLSGTLEVRDESFMGIDLVVPGDIARCEDGFPFSGYLFPGEKIEKRTSIGDFDRYITSTGRNIFVYDGSVVYGNGWKGDYDRIRSRMMLMEILALFENPRSLRELEEANDDLGRLHHSALEGDRDKGGSWYGSGIKLGDDTRAGVISGPVLTHWSDGKQRLMTASGSRNDPLRLLSYHLKGFLEGNKGTSAITDHLEKLIKDLRSSTPISDLDRIRKASLISEREIRRSLRSILKGGVKVETVRNLLLNLMISHLTRTEALTSWNDEYVNSWNILGIERKRGIKSELSSLFELLDELDDAQKRVNARHNSYRKNMEVRRTLDAVSRVRVSGSSVRPGGVPGTPWRAKIVFEGLVKDGGGKVMPLIKLPGPGWNLVDTMASREGNVFRLDEVDTLSGNIDLELVVSSPVTASGQNNALVYLMPSRYEMEVEP